MNTAEFLIGRVDAGATAVVDADGTLTYGQLAGRVAQQARALRELDLLPGDRVGLIGANGSGWVSSYLAVLAAGLVAVPVANTLPAEEVAARLGWIGAAASFVGVAERRKLAGLVGIQMPMDGPAPSTSAEDGPTFAPVRPDDDAVLAFTSGTTGRPRAVRQTHANLQANTGSILGYLPLTDRDRILVVLPFSYVFGASLLHTHLRIGASLVIHPNAVFPQQIVERMADERCTGVAGVPSTFAVLLRNSTFGSRRLPNLRLIQQAGGKLAPALLNELREAQPQAQVFVMYGQTEATARLSYLPPEQLDRKLGSIGRGIPGVSLRVVGDDGADISPGEVGEIRARGANISPGYLDDEAETARRMPDGELHTGDLATVDEEGYIYVVDRQEDFIKSWGLRIASQDVETVALQMTDLVSAVVVGVPDEAAGELVEMVAVAREGATVTEREVIDHCRAKLARYMVPSRVHFVPLIPLNTNGKVAKPAVRDLCLGWK